MADPGLWQRAEASNPDPARVCPVQEPPRPTPGSRSSSHPFPVASLVSNTQLSTPASANTVCSTALPPLAERARASTARLASYKPCEGGPEPRAFVSMSAGDRL